MASMWKVKVDQSTEPSPAIDAGEVRRAMSLFADHEHGTEFRAIPLADGPPLSRVRQARDIDALIRSARAIAKGNTLYFVLNPVRANLVKAAEDSDVVCRMWSFIDIDPAKADGVKVSATNEEKAQARALADEVDAFLSGEGFSESVLVDSGNGWYLIHRVEMPNTEESRSLMQRFLVTLSSRYTGTRGKIDTSVYNASRLAKLPGTWARKGPNATDRPHRMARIVRIPQTIAPVPAEAFLRIAGEEPPATSTLRVFAPSSGAPYGAKAMAGEIGRILLAPEGERNNTYFKACANLAELVAGGSLDESEMRSQMLLAAGRIGLESQESIATLESAIKAGSRNPRRPPDPNHVNGKTPSGKTVKVDGQPPWKVTYDDNTLAEGTPDKVLDGITLEDGPHTKLFELRTMGSLLAKKFPEPTWVIPGIMSEGLNLLAGAPKMGKSMLALNLALTIAGGGMALGNIPVDPADVLYLSLEDKQRRVQARAIKMLKAIDPKFHDSIRKRLTIATNWPRQDDGGLQLLELWCRQVKSPGLVIIDVWNRFSPKQDGRRSGYSQDSDDLGQVKSFSDKRSLASLVVHHTRKPGAGKEDQDYVLEVSGTSGITGAADGIMVLLRARQEEQAHFHIVGRDVEERELVLEFDADHLTWKNLGSAADHLKGEVQQAIVRFLRTRGEIGASAPEIAEAVKQKANSVRQALNRLLADRVVFKRGNLWRYPFDEDGGERDEITL